MEKLNTHNLLLVEGKDEENFFKAILKHLRIDSVQVLAVQGKDNFTNVLSAVTKLSNFPQVKKLLLVRDADYGSGAANSAFDSLKKALENSALASPEKPAQWSKEKNALQTCIFIMPNNEDEGMLETLCMQSFSDEQKQHIQKFLEKNGNIKKERYDKAQLLAWLALRGAPVTSLGLAAQKGELDFSNICFEALKAILESFSGK